MDRGWRMGRSQDGFGSIQSAPPSRHPLFGGLAPSRSLLETDPHWTDVNGKRPAPKVQGHNARQVGEDEPRLCRMQGGNVAYLLPKRPPAASSSSGAGLARSRSAPGAAASSKATSEQPHRWRSRETFVAFESWRNNTPAALVAPAKGRKRAPLAEGTLRPAEAGR
mmetsp:Transcript_39619/g.101208  ORF Transcript_39619/g.101208 Transcript_39619/m.101208 type:complete len:166 (+) Transcript_39619:2-499(+)